MEESKVPIVNCIVANLRADIANLNSRHRLVSLHVSDGHNKGLDAIVTLDSDAPRKDDSVSGLHTQIAWPEFAGFKRGRMDDELVIFNVKSCRCLEPCNVTAVT